MVDRALFDFAEAALGHNTAMQWSLDESISRKQLSPIFRRCATGELTAEEALDVSMDNLNAKVEHTRTVFSRLFTTLEDKIEKQDPTSRNLPALTKIEELFLGFDSQAEWATSDEISRQELYPLFVRCAVGRIDPDKALEVFLDNMIVKRETYMERVRDLTRELAVQLHHAKQQHLADIDKGVGEVGEH